MSIKGRMASYSLYRSANTLDTYGIMSATPSKITDIQVAIFKNEPAHDRANPSYDISSYIGVTEYVGALIGDTLQGVDGTKYQITDVGNRITRNQPLYLTKL